MVYNKNRIKKFKAQPQQLLILYIKISKQQKGNVITKVGPT